jgi:hypothetical protein
MLRQITSGMISCLKGREGALSIHQRVYRHQLQQTKCQAYAQDRQTFKTQRYFQLTLTLLALGY